MENKFLCLMAGYDKDTEDYLAGIQKKLYAVGLNGQHTKNIPQHITLQTYPTDQETEVVRMLQEIAAETAPFDVCFSHIGIFTGGGSVVHCTGQGYGFDRAERNVWSQFRLDTPYHHAHR